MSQHTSFLPFCEESRLGGNPQHARDSDFPEGDPTPVEVVGRDFENSSVGTPVVSVKQWFSSLGPRGPSTVQKDPPRNRLLTRLILGCQRRSTPLRSRTEGTSHGYRPTPVGGVQNPSTTGRVGGRGGRRAEERTKDLVKGSGREQVPRWSPRTSDSNRFVSGEYVYGTPGPGVPGRRVRDDHDCPLGRTSRKGDKAPCCVQVLVPGNPPRFVSPRIHIPFRRRSYSQADLPKVVRLPPWTLSFDSNPEGSRQHVPPAPRAHHPRVCDGPWFLLSPSPSLSPSPPRPSFLSSSSSSSPSSPPSPSLSSSPHPSFLLFLLLSLFTPPPPLCYPPPPHPSFSSSSSSTPLFTILLSLSPLAYPPLPLPPHPPSLLSSSSSSPFHPSFLSSSPSFLLPLLPILLFLLPILLLLLLLLPPFLPSFRSWGGQENVYPGTRTLHGLQWGVRNRLGRHTRPRGLEGSGAHFGTGW